MSSSGVRLLGPGVLQRIESPRGPVYRFTYTDGQHRRVRVNLSRDKRVAEAASRELIRKRDLQLAGIGMLGSQNELLLDLLEKYIADLRGRSSSKGYVEIVNSHVRYVVKELKVERVRDLRPHAVLEMRSKLRASGLAVSTANRYVTCVSTMLRWAVSVELVGENPLRNVKPIPLNEKNKTKRRRALLEPEITRLLEAARLDDIDQAERLAAKMTIRSQTQGRRYALRVRAVRVPQAPLWRAFLETGARYFELVSARWCDVDFERRVLRLRAVTTKSARERCIPLRDETLDELRALRPFHERVHRRSLNPDDRLFVTPEGRAHMQQSGNLVRRLTRLLELAGIDRRDSEGRTIDLHALRHSFATRLARNGVSQVQTAKILGHSDVRLTTSVYQHLESEDLRGAIDTLASPPVPPRVTEAARFA